MDFRNGVGDARNVCSDAADARWAKIFPPSLRTVALGEKFRRYTVRDNVDLTLFVEGATVLLGFFPCPFTL